jgi:hypothetical protein
MRFVRGVFIAVAALLATGCTTQFLTAPDVSLVDRSAVNVMPPLAIAISDLQQGEREKDFTGKLSTAIQSSYGHAVEIIAPDSFPIAGRVNVRIRIVELGAFFERRSAWAYLPSEIPEEVIGQVADWDEVAKSAAPTSEVIKGRVFNGVLGPDMGVVGKNWSGIAHIEIDVQDLRPSRAASFTVVLFAERTAPNVYGYMTAQNQAGEAWKQVGPRLSQFFDAAIDKVSTEQAR